MYALLLSPSPPRPPLRAVMGFLTVVVRRRSVVGGFCSLSGWFLLCCLVWCEMSTVWFLYAVSIGSVSIVTSLIGEGNKDVGISRGISEDRIG